MLPLKVYSMCGCVYVCVFRQAWQEIHFLNNFSFWCKSLWSSHRVRDFACIQNVAGKIALFVCFRWHRMPQDVFREAWLRRRQHMPPFLLLPHPISLFHMHTHMNTHTYMSTHTHTHIHTKLLSIVLSSKAEGFLN